MRNPDKDRAMKEMVRDADAQPDELRLWNADGGYLVMPRGFAHRLEALAAGYDVPVEWESHMALLPYSERCFRDWPAFPLDENQVPARDALLEWAQGILQAPTGSGKTVVALETARWAGQKTLVVVGKTSLARQWQTAIKERYGYDAGYIGEGEWDECDFTIATWQTLWRKEIPRSFWGRWGMVIFDECHHASAESLADLAGRFSAFYRVGLSATPNWTPLLFPIVSSVIGPIIHEADTKRILKPTVRMIETTFEREYIPTHFEKRKRVQNNYSEIMAELVVDPTRNDLIARIARDEAQAGHHVVIVTRRTEHVRQLVSRLEKVFHVGVDLFTLTGKQTGAYADRIREAIAASEKGTVLISTVVDEGFDVPRLDRIILSFPLRKVPLVEQQIGRILRSAPEKEDALVFDIVDPGIGPVESQKRDRLHLYLKRKWKVELETEEVDA